MRSCPGPTALASDGVTPTQAEDPGTLAACAAPTGLSSGASAGQVLANFQYTAQVTPPGTNVYEAPLVAGGPSPSPFPFPTGFATTAQQSQSLDYSKVVNWTSGNTSVVDVSNVYGSQGQAIYHTATPGSVNVTASYIFQAGVQALAPAAAPLTQMLRLVASQLAGTPATPTLSSILVTPSNRIYSSATGSGTFAIDHYFATGFYTDGSVRDLTNLVTWSVNTTSSFAGAAQFNPQVANQLQVPQSLGNGNLTIGATVNSTTGLANAATAFPVAPPTITSVTPASGRVSGGTSVTVLGTNLAGVSSVTFSNASGTANASFVVIVNGTELLVTAPPAPGGLTGPATVTIATSQGNVTATYVYTSGL